MYTLYQYMQDMLEAGKADCQDIADRVEAELLSPTVDDIQESMRVPGDTVRVGTHDTN